MIIFGFIGIVQSIINLILAAAPSSSFVESHILSLRGITYDVSAIYSIAHVISALGFIWQVCAALRYSICMLCCVILVILYYFAISVYYAVEVQSDYWVDDTNTALIIQIICNVFLCGLYIYPVVGLIVEIKKGIMSKETYPREAYSCCTIKAPEAPDEYHR